MTRPAAFRASRTADPPSPRVSVEGCLATSPLVMEQRMVGL